MSDTILNGLRIIDLSRDVAGAYGAKLLAGFGADVIKLEPPGGDPTRWLPPRIDGSGGASPDGGILFAYLNTGKRSIGLDPDVAGERDALLRLLRGADLIIESAAPGEWAARGIDFDALLEAEPALVVCSVTPFGQTGPRADWRLTALTAFAAGGQMAICGEPGRPPLKTAGHQAGYQGGLHVFSSSLTALLAAQRTGLGDRIDISLQEVQAASLEGAGPNSMVHGLDAERRGNQARAIWGIYPCADGHVGVNAMRRQTAAVYACIGHPELADDPANLDILVNPGNNDLVAALILEWTSRHTSEEIFAASQEHRAPFSRIPEPAALLDNEHLRQTGFWSHLDHPVLGPHTVPGAPFIVDGERAALRRAPLLGEHSAELRAELEAPAAPPSTPAPAMSDPTKPPPNPMQGIRVLDLTQVWAGPYATRFLADMGADVIHLEGPAFPDAVRGVGRSDEPRGYDRSAYFNEYNRGKRGLALDLQRPEGVEIVKQLLPGVDVVIENWSVGVAERLGLGYEALRAERPDIVFVQMPAFGQTGPEARRVGFGPTIEQMGGLVALQGYEGGEPQKSGISYGDPTGGTLAAGAVALALWRRERSGEGAHVVVAQRDNIAGMIGEYLVAQSADSPLPLRIGSRDTAMAPHNAYRCRDDAGRTGAIFPGDPPEQFHETWLAIAVDSDAAWLALRDQIGDPDLDDPSLASAAGRLKQVDLIDLAIAAWTRDQEANQAAERLQAAGVSASPVFTPLMLRNDAHLAEREFFVEVEHPIVGRHTTARPVWRLTRRPFQGATAAPMFGQDNEAILTEVAGLSETDYVALVAKGIVSDEPVSA